MGKKQPAAIISNSESDVEDTPLNNYFSWTDDKEMLKCFECLPDEECYLNLSDDLVTDKPLDTFAAALLQSILQSTCEFSLLRHGNSSLG